jgi:hypothetical protein
MWQTQHRTYHDLVESHPQKMVILGIGGSWGSAGPGSRRGEWNACATSALQSRGGRRLVALMRVIIATKPTKDDFKGLCSYHNETIGSWWCFINHPAVTRWQLADPFYGLRVQHAVPMGYPKLIIPWDADVESRGPSPWHLLGSADIRFVEWLFWVWTLSKKFLFLLKMS